jgi:hypothetical protein
MKMTGAEYHATMTDAGVVGKVHSVPFFTSVAGKLLVPAGKKSVWTRILANQLGAACLIHISHELRHRAARRPLEAGLPRGRAPCRFGWPRLSDSHPCLQQCRLYLDLEPKDRQCRELVFCPWQTLCAARTLRSQGVDAGRQGCLGSAHVLLGSPSQPME